MEVASYRVARWGGMKRVLKVLHLASFSGNIGDNANHAGARAQFAQNLSFQLDYTELEIREFYWKYRFFDESFIDYVNQFDLLLIGGGNYFELWVEHSRTGCSIDLPPDMLARIHCPVIFYGLGVDAGQGVPDICLQRFRKFMDYLLAHDRFFIAVRNDGAVATLEKFLGSHYAQAVSAVPDGGFFVTPGHHQHPELANFPRNLVINLAGDMLDTRFKGSGGRLSPQGFFKEFALCIERLLEANTDMGVVFIPHIFRDYEPVSAVIECLPDAVRRRRLAVGPYLTGTAGADKQFSLYQQASLVLAMRFHASVCPIGMGVSTLGLVCYPQISHLYRELDLMDCAIDVTSSGFSSMLFDKSQHALGGLDSSGDSVVSHLLGSIQTTHKKIDAWLQRQFG